MAQVRIAILMCEWGTPVAGVTGTRWSKDLVREVFENRNGWSIGSWWDSCSLGHWNPQFDIYEIGTLPATQETFNRGDLLARVIALAGTRGVPVGSYEHHVAFMHPNPNPSGGWNNDAVLDRDASHQYFAHEIGHVLGLKDAFGFGPDQSARMYADEFCIMGGFARGHDQPPGALSAQDLANIGPRLWHYGIQPSGAALFAFCQPFRDSNRVQTLTAGTEGEFQIAAMSEAQLPFPVLFRIPAGPGQDFLVEYRIPTGWDRGMREPTLVVHSFGLPSRSDATPKRRGYRHVWFEKAIPAPFMDNWWYHFPAIGIEVVGRAHDDKALLVKVTTPENLRSATLVERPGGRVEYGTLPAETGTVHLNRDSDASLCHAETRPYGVTIHRFNESAELDVSTSGFQSPVIEEWRVHTGTFDPLLPGTQSFSIWPMLSWTRIEDTPPDPPYLRKYTVQGPGWPRQMRLTPRADGATLTVYPGGCSFSVNVEVVVRDTALDPSNPAARRVAAIDVHYVGERIEWSEGYKDAAESCWTRRIRGRDRYLRRPPQMPAPEPPPWLDPDDRQVLRRVEERIAAGTPRVRDKPRER